MQISMIYDRTKIPVWGHGELSLTEIKQRNQGNQIATYLADIWHLYQPTYVLNDDVQDFLSKTPEELRATFSLSLLEDLVVQVPYWDTKTRTWAWQPLEALKAQNPIVGYRIQPFSAETSILRLIPLDALSECHYDGLTNNWATVAQFSQNAFMDEYIESIQEELKGS